MRIRLLPIRRFLELRRTRPSNVRLDYSWVFFKRLYNITTDGMQHTLRVFPIEIWFWSTK